MSLRSQEERVGQAHCSVLELELLPRSGNPKCVTLSFPRARPWRIRFHQIPEKTLWLLRS
jgi:hypothetical protein